MLGRIIKVDQFKPDNAVSFKYKVGDVPSGKYILKIVSTNGTESAELRFEKLE